MLYDNMLNGTPKPTSQLRWYNAQLNLLFITLNWASTWHGGKAISFN